MQLYSFLFILFSFPPIPFYSIQLTSLDGKTISMADYKGKRVLIATIDIDKYNEKQLLFLDSIQTHTPDLQVVIVPASSKESTEEDRLKTDSRQLTSSLVISRSGKISKEAGREQNKLMEWLTKSENNNVFEIEGEPGQYYLVSIKGTICAALGASISQKDLLGVLNYPFDLSKHYIFNPETQRYERPQD